MENDGKPTNDTPPAEQPQPNQATTKPPQPSDIIHPTAPSDDGFTEELATDEEHHQIVKQQYALPVDQKRKKKMPSFKVSTPLLIGLGIIVAGVAGAAVIWSRHETPVQEVAPVTAIQKIADMGIALTLSEGTVEVSSSEKDPEQAAFATLTSATRLHEAQFIRTAENSRVILTLDDGSAIRLNSNSLVQLTRLKVNDINIELLAGEAYTRVVSNTERNFVVSTKDQQFQSVGTAFITMVTPDKEGVQTFQSTVRLSDGTTVDEGMQYFSINSAEPESVDAVIAIPKTELTANPFITWNREQDIAILEFKDKMGILGDLDAPTITLTNPTKDITTKDTKITITGTSEVDAIVSINGINTPLKSGVFSYELPLNEGLNAVTITATDASGNTAEKKIAITRKTEQQAEAPISTPLKLSGQTGSNGIEVSWSVNPTAQITGKFKIVYGLEGTPTFPEYQSQLSDDTGTLIPKKDGKTYRLRVCVYRESDNTCNQYSNLIEVKAPKQ